jgi:hypothetical protein
MLLAVSCRPWVALRTRWQHRAGRAARGLQLDRPLAGEHRVVGAGASRLPWPWQREPSQQQQPEPRQRLWSSCQQGRQQQQQACT